MLEFALNFSNNYTILFYILLTIAVIIEGPITILGLSLIAPKFEISYFTILFFAFVGEFFGDLLHYIVGKFAKDTFFKKSNYNALHKLNQKLHKHSLFDKLIVIKYTPPITSIGLIYLGFNKTSITDFIKNDLILVIVSSIFITLVGYNFGVFLGNKDNFLYLITILLLSFMFFYFCIKISSKYLIKKILNEKR